MENGEGTRISINYEIFGFAEFKKQYTMDDVRFFAVTASEEAKSSCKDKSTYRPQKIGISFEGDSITTTLSFSEKNSIGDTHDLSGFCTFIGKTLISSR